MAKFEKRDLTYRIIGSAMRVHNKLGRGFKEYVYCRALAIELRREGIAFKREIWLPIHFDQYRIAARRCDFLCQERVILEIKAIGELGKAEKVQAINTVERLNQSDGLLITFGANSLEYHRIFNNNVRPSNEFIDVTPELVGEEADDLFTARHYIPDWEIAKMQRERAKEEWEKRRGY